MLKDFSWRPARSGPAWRFGWWAAGASLAVALALTVVAGRAALPAATKPPASPGTPFAAAAPAAADAPVAAGAEGDGLVGPPWPLDVTAGLRAPGVLSRIESVELRPRQTPAAALLALGASSEAVGAALASLGELMDFRRMRPGDVLKARFDAQDRLIALDVRHGFMDQVRSRLGEGGWHGERIDVAVDTVVAEVRGQVRSSLWDALVGHGEDPRLVAMLVEIFAYDIDFYTEVRPNDRFCLLVEKRYANGQFLEYGEVAAAEFFTGDQPHRAFRNHGSTGAAAYYDEQGRALRKQLLRAPLKYAPVTSTFGLRRHPVLGYTRNHNGTDYGVPVGTPVWSVGDGRVVTAGWHGGFGRLVEIAHPNGWLSQYAHLSRINVRLGQRVQQKDVVGLVGQTGLATGPHLHYGLKKNGQYVNSLAQRFERNPPLAGLDMAAFAAQVSKLMRDLNKLRVAEQSLVPSPEKG